MLCAFYFDSFFFFFFKQKTAYEMRISDWSSDVCSSDLVLSQRLSRLPRSAVVAGAGWRGGAVARRHCRRGRGLRPWAFHQVDGRSIPQQIGRDTSELQSLMRISYAVFCLKKKKKKKEHHDILAHTSYRHTTLNPTTMCK